MVRTEFKKAYFKIFLYQAKVFVFFSLVNTLFAITIFELDIILIFIFWQEVKDNEILQVMLLAPTTLPSDKSSRR